MPSRPSRRVPGLELLVGEGVVEALHPLEVVDRGELGGDGAADLLGGRVGCAQVGHLAPRAPRAAASSCRSRRRRGSGRRARSSASARPRPPRRARGAPGAGRPAGRSRGWRRRAPGARCRSRPLGLRLAHGSILPCRTDSPGDGDASGRPPIRSLAGSETLGDRHDRSDACPLPDSTAGSPPGTRAASC